MIPQLKLTDAMRSLVAKKDGLAPKVQAAITATVAAAATPSAKASELKPLIEKAVSAMEPLTAECQKCIEEATALKSEPPPQVAGLEQFGAEVEKLVVVPVNGFLERMKQTTTQVTMDGERKAAQAEAKELMEEAEACTTCASALADFTTAAASKSTLSKLDEHKSKYAKMKTSLEEKLGKADESSAKNFAEVRRTIHSADAKVTSATLAVEAFEAKLKSAETLKPFRAKAWALTKAVRNVTKMAAAIKKG